MRLTRRFPILLITLLLLTGLYGQRTAQAGDDPQLTPPPSVDYETEQGDESTQQAAPTEATFEPGSILLQLSAEIGQPLYEALLSDTPFNQLPFPDELQLLNSQYAARELRTLAPLSSLAYGEAASSGIRYLFQLDVKPQATEQAVVAYNSTDLAISAELNTIGQISMTPNDTLWSSLWGMTTIGMETAWDNAPAAGSGITVAVIDTGVNLTHPDLDDNLAPVAGWYDFVDSDFVPDDLNGHGTHVAGTIAAEGNNALGVIGVAFNADILPIRALNAAGSGTMADLIGAVAHATNPAWSVDVINNSWGAPGRSAFLEIAVNAAHSADILVVSAAGNHSGNPTYRVDTCHFGPTNIENSMSVGASDSIDMLSSFSDTGVKIDVMAPGVGINSTVLGSGYAMQSGTSMAAPHVSGLAALIRQQHPTWNVEQVKQAIRITADESLGSDGDFDPESGFGRIDAAAATSISNTPVAASVTSPRNCDTVSGTVAVAGSAFGTPSFMYEVWYGAGEDPAVKISIAFGSLSLTNATLANWNTTGLAEGVYTIGVTATSPAGVVSEDRNVVLVDHFMESGFPAPVEGFGLSQKAVKVADLDGDSSNEIVIGSTVFDTAGNPAAGWDNNPGNGRTTPAIVNIDGDSTLEIVHIENPCPTYCPSLPLGGSPQVYAYNPDGTTDWVFSPDNPLTAGSNFEHGIPSAVSAGDVDGDGQMEIIFSLYFVYGNTAQETTVFVLDAATGTLELQQNVSGSSLSAVALGDLDNDGVEDMVIESYSGSGTGIIHALHGDGTLVPGWPQVDDKAIGRQDPVLGDIDCDGNLNVLVSNKVREYSGTMSPAWTAAPAYIARSSGIFTPLTDGDSEMELVLGGGNNIVYWVNEHNAPLKYSKSDGGENLNIIGIGYDNFTQGTPISADINNDGNFDIIRQHEQAFLDRRPSNIYGSESTTSASPAPLNRQVWDLYRKLRGTSAVADVDGDGDTELLLFANRHLHVWDFPGAQHPNNPWPMYQHDLRNSGNIGSYSCPSVDLELEKEAIGYFEFGGIGSYELTVTNVGSTATTSPITVSDFLPTGMSYVSAGPFPWSCVAGSPVSCTYGGSLAPSGSTTLVLNVAISGNASTPTENCATVSTIGDSNASNNSDCTIHEVTQSLAPSDLGDAPDSTNHGGSWMSTYFWPAAIARFPTVFDASTGTPEGPMHKNAEGDAWLGKVVSTEREADVMPFADQDGVSNIRDPWNNSQNRDRYDDGVILSTVNLPRCWFTTYKYNANVVGGSGSRLLNTWIDYNRDGDFEDRVPCTITWGSWSWTIWVSEWSVRNRPVNLDDGFNSNLTSPFFFAARNTGFFGDQGWMRVSLSPTSQPAPFIPGVQSGNDGRGPVNGYDTGETEDYRLRRRWIWVTATPDTVSTVRVMHTNGLTGTTTIPAGAVDATVEVAIIPTSPHTTPDEGETLAAFDVEVRTDAGRSNEPFVFTEPITVEVPAACCRTHGGYHVTVLKASGIGGWDNRDNDCDGDTGDDDLFVPADGGVLEVPICEAGEYRLSISRRIDQATPLLARVVPVGDNDILEVPIGIEYSDDDFRAASFTFSYDAACFAFDPLDDDDDGIPDDITLTELANGTTVQITPDADTGQIMWQLSSSSRLQSGYIGVAKIRGLCGNFDARSGGAGGFGISNLMVTDSNGTESAGADATSEPLYIDPADLSSCDLQTSISDSGSFAYSGEGSYQLQVSNVGSTECAGEITVSGTLPEGVTLAESQASSDWTCAATDDVEAAFICSHAGPATVAASLPMLDLSVLLPATGDGTGWDADELTQCVRVTGSAESDTSNNESCSTVSVDAATPTAAALQAISTATSSRLAVALSLLTLLLATSFGITRRQE